MRLFGRRIFDFWVAEESGRLVGSTLVTYGVRAGFLSTVAVRPAYRRRGIAQALLARAHEEIRSGHRPYAALQVLRENAPAQALYARLGYRKISTSTVFAREPGPTDATYTPPGGAAIRSFARPDGTALAALVNASLSPEVREVLPSYPGAFSLPPLLASSTHSESTAWVLLSGERPVGFLRATVGGITRSAHLTQPILGPEVGTESALALVRTGLAWIASHAPVRAVVEVPEGATLPRETLATLGFESKFTTDLLVRGSGA